MDIGKLLKNIDLNRFLKKISLKITTSLQI
jgi:hypothetical protein